MRVIWYAPGEGLGKPSRAAAVCRHLDDVVVVRAGWHTAPLDDAEVPYVRVWRRDEVPAAIEKLDGDLLVVDQRPDAPEVLALKPRITSLYLHRLGRSFAPDPGVTIERSREGWVDLWPILYKSPENSPPRSESRRMHAIPEDVHLTLVVPSVAHSHRWPEDSYAGDKWTKVVRDWPAMNQLPGADRVIGAPGYNLWNEVNALGLDAQWHYVTNSSRDQELRVDEPKREYTGNKDRALADHIMSFA